MPRLTPLLLLALFGCEPVPVDDTDGGGGGTDTAPDPATLDTDGDGLTDAQEAELGTDPTLVDTDGDGLSDAMEVSLLTNPLQLDTDGDGLSDGAEVNDTHTDPLVADTDGDGLSDGVEVNDSHTDPLVQNIDADGDGSWATEDCDDTNADVFPGGTETPYNGLDDDCDAATLDDDLDGDTFPKAQDCDDTQAAVHPDATELCNGVDDDCDGSVDPTTAEDATVWYADVDGDTYGDAADSSSACVQPVGYVADATDCDDGAVAVHPGATELCNGVDDDCDGVVDPDTASDAPTWYLDADADAWGDPAVSVTACLSPSGHVGNSEDCDDSRADVRPGTLEVCNGVDDDCDGVIDPPTAEGASVWFADVDADTYGNEASSTTACEQPSGFVSDATDCDDAVAAVHPQATEVCNGVDDDCDGVIDPPTSADAMPWYLDGDTDTYGDPNLSKTACSAPSGHVGDNTDCNDADPAINPGMTEVLNNRIDDDCDPSTWDVPPPDDDQDGFTADVDCDDTDPTIYPGANDPLDGYDRDCDGLDIFPMPTTGLYVSAITGSDTNPGSITAPFQTIGRAMLASTAPNDLIFIAGGTYPEALDAVDDSLLGGYSTDFATWDPVAGAASITGEPGFPTLASSQTGMLWSGLSVEGGPDSLGMSLTGSWSSADAPLRLVRVSALADATVLWADFGTHLLLDRVSFLSVFGNAAELSGRATVTDSLMVGGWYGLLVAEGIVSVERSELDGSAGGLAVDLVMESRNPYAHVVDSTIVGDRRGAALLWGDTLIEHSTLRSRGDVNYPESAGVYAYATATLNRCVIEGGVGSSASYGVQGGNGTTLLNSVARSSDAPGISAGYFATGGTVIHSYLQSGDGYPSAAFYTAPAGSIHRFKLINTVLDLNLWNAPTGYPLYLNRHVLDEATLQGVAFGKDFADPACLVAFNDPAAPPLQCANLVAASDCAQWPFGCLSVGGLYNDPLWYVDPVADWHHDPDSGVTSRAVDATPYLPAWVDPVLLELDLYGVPHRTTADPLPDLGPAE